ncbi:MAG: heme o synthase [Planctomycetota bacterium]
MKDDPILDHAHAAPVEPHVPAARAAGLAVRLHDYFELLKPRLTMLVLLTVAGGYVMGSPAAPHFAALWHVLIGMTLVVGGGATLNQYLERGTDGLMRRTQNRPLPAHRMDPSEVLVYGAALATAGLVYLELTADLAVMLLAAAAAAIYLLAYTPLKRRTVLNTLVGGITGALPPLIGWAAARGGHVSAGAWALFAILFIWQMPHFFALSWCFKDDYQNAGIRTLSGLHDGGRMVMAVIVLFALVQIPAALAPAWLGVSGRLYFYAALFLSVAFFGLCAKLAWTRSRRDAWVVFWASIAWLPLIFSVMLYDRIPM